MAHKVTANWQGGMEFKADTGSGSVSLDAAKEFGGQNNGLRSKPLMLTALAGCTAMDVSSLMHKMRLDVEHFEVVVEAEITEEHPKVYTKVHVIYNFSGLQLNEEKLTRAVELSFDTYCGVIAMFKQFADVSYEINYRKG
ncbi:MAG: OsmC family protein [Flavobacteriales bacterium]|jgi:putative redox protein|nr:OsmC family protein [Flavobacteriales bacterium]